MKLLIDQNLAWQLCEHLQDLFPDSRHVKDFQLQEKDDLTIWQFAKENHYHLVTKDSDFHELSFLYGSPPKVIWIKTGNIPTKKIEFKIRSLSDEILFFLQEEFSTVLIVE